jgi:hypothetical protein
MKAFLKYCLAVITVALLILAGSVVCLAETEAENSAHSLSLTLPDGYVLLNSETAEDHLSLIESLGYSLSSFKNYLKPAGDGLPSTLFIGLDPTTRAQITVKSWSTDFSKRVGSFAFLDSESLSLAAKELVTTKGASYKTVTANGMKLIEIRSTTKDSGGEFCSVQYITVCNSNFYSLNFAFSGAIDDGKVATAWGVLNSFEIKNKIPVSAFDFGSIMVIILIFLAIIGTLVFAAFIIVSIVKDLKKRRLDPDEDFDFIKRRK